MKLPKANYDPLNFATMPAHHQRYQINMNKGSRNAVVSKTHSMGTGGTSSVIAGSRPSASLIKAKANQNSSLEVPNIVEKEEDYEQDFENPEKDYED